MGDIRVRKLGDDIIGVWRDRARAHGRSLEAELRALLEQEATRPWRELAERLRASRLSPPGEAHVSTDSAVAIREERDSWG